MTKEQIKEGLDKAYKEAGHNAYFGNGFEAGVKFVLNAQKTAHNSDYAKCKHTKECKFHNGYLPVIADKTM